MVRIFAIFNTSLLKAESLKKIQYLLLQSFCCQLYTWSTPCTIPIECCGEPPVEEAVVLMRRSLVAPVDQARAGRVVVVGELLPVGDGWGGELVPLHLLLLNSQVSAHNFEIDIASTIKMRTKLCSSSQMAVLTFILLEALTRVIWNAGSMKETQQMLCTSFVPTNRYIHFFSLSNVWTSEQDDQRWT